MTDDWLSYFFTEDEIYGASEWAGPAIAVLEILEEVVQIIEPVIPFADEIFEVAVEAGAAFGKFIAPIFDPTPTPQPPQGDPFDLGRIKSLGPEPSPPRDNYWTTNTTPLDLPFVAPQPEITFQEPTEFTPAGRPEFNLDNFIDSNIITSNVVTSNVKERSMPGELMPFFGIPYDTPDKPPDDIVAYTWNTGTATFYRLINGKIAVRTKRGVWKIWYPKKMIVISNNPRLQTFNRAASKMEKIGARLEKSFKSVKRTRQKKG